MSDQLTHGLFVSSMIFFNIFCVLGIITSFVLIWAIFSIRNQVTSTLALIQETTSNITEITSDIAENIIPQIFRPRKSWIDLALKLIKR